MNEYKHFVLVMEMGTIVHVIISQYAMFIDDIISINSDLVDVTFT